jgi:predicted amidohydrolase YtcJ
MSKDDTQSTFLFNGNVLTLDDQNSVGTGLLIDDGRISRVVTGSENLSNGHRLIDLDGATVLPGFIDPHAHPLSLGASLGAIDCSPEFVSSVTEIVDRIAEAASGSRGDWILARGYDELLLAEGRHPNAADLDGAAPGRRIRLSHGSGHGDVLSTAAMKVLGLNRDSVAPSGASIEHDPVSGELTGVMFEMGGWLRDRIPGPSDETLNEYAEIASSVFVAAGVTAVTDAGRDNTADRASLYAALISAGRFLPRPTVMQSPDSRFPTPGETPGVRSGAAKIAITFSGGEMYPDFATLVAQVLGAHRANRQVAIHAVELEAVVMASEAFTAVGPKSDISNLRHRIEHGSECPPEISAMIAAAGLSVVTQPGFIYERGDRYLRASANAHGAEPGSLYAAQDLLTAQVHVAASSDTPFGPIAPLIGIQAAVTRTSSSGNLVGPEQAISVMDALRMYGPNAAWVDHREAEIGSLEPGKLADLVVLQSDLIKISPAEIGAIPVMGTLIAGKVVHGSLPGD